MAPYAAETMNHAALDKLLQKAGKAFERSAPNEALEHLFRALKLAPGNALILMRIGIALHLLQRTFDAEQYYLKAIRNSRTLGEAHNNLGKLYLETDKNSEAAEAFRQAAALLPHSPLPASALATALQRMNRIHDAEEICRVAISKFPGFAEPHHTLASLLLIQGRYREGWQEYEWRWETNRPPFTKRRFSMAAWHGEEIPGKRLLVHAEQGLGDTIQFSRFIPLVASASRAHLTIECHPSLHPVITTVHSGLKLASMVPSDSPFDYQVSLVSLAGILGITKQNVPSSDKYLHVPLTFSESWQALFDNDNVRLKVGVCWSGNKYPDPGRSCPDEIIRELFTCEHVTFYPLRPGTSLQPGMSNTRNLTSRIQGFDDTAGLIEQMDLVISIDTSVAHLAGALGKPTWVMLPYAPDWRWGLDGDTTPWYNSMRLFRQQKQSDWHGLVCQVKESLTEFAKSNDFQSG
ncbi:MAG TPA: tetratricopeptide repeat protein [Desulfuromonadales bacterium]|nr:tetratricopeptide repeat protein [Desulfuromonadales bacterium]